MALSLRISLTAFFVFLVLAYGGIRSPDSEAMFVTTQLLVEHGSFGREEGFVWEGFGMHRGVDGQYYSLFGPAVPIAAIPLYKLARLLNQTGWYRQAPGLVGVSHYVEHQSVEQFLTNAAPTKLEQHALRTITSLFNVIISALCVGLFFLTARLLSHSGKAALLTTILFAFGTMLLPYSGTFFSEPLTTLLVLLSLYFLIRAHGCTNSQLVYLLVGSGLALGLAITSHISAVLFGPFFLFYAVVCQDQAFPGKRPPLLRAVVLFSVGVVLFLFLLGCYNYVRFGSPLETGRTVDPDVVYASFVAPWGWLLALLVGSGKGLFIYSPAALLAILLWRPFHQRYPLLSWMLIAAILFRLLFIASRSDWHGGFSLGPRYLVVLLPLLLLPLSIVVAEWLGRRKIRHLLSFGIFTFICISQQLFFALGEIFAFSHIVRKHGEQHDINVFENSLIYLDWDVSPAIYLLESYTGPLLLRDAELGNYPLWGIMTMIALASMTLLYKNALSSR